MRLPGAKTISTGVMAILMPFTLHHEGLKTKAYLDSGGVPTICIGETENVRMGDVKTVKECTTMAYVKLGAISLAVDYLVKPEVGDNVIAAFSDFSYNVGINAFRNSTMLKKVNNGDLLGACNQFPLWYRVGPMDCRKPVYRKICGGIPVRRENERKLCLGVL